MNDFYNDEEYKIELDEEDLKEEEELIDLTEESTLI